VETRTYRREIEFRLGAVARASGKEQDLFVAAADPLIFSARRLRFPSGPAGLDIPLMPRRLPEDDFDCERWDGLS
jgi:hypothetical protein